MIYHIILKELYYDIIIIITRTDSCLIILNMTVLNFQSCTLYGSSMQHDDMMVMDVGVN